MTLQSPNNVQIIKAWYQQVIDACDFHDTISAFSALRGWDEMIRLLPDQQRDEIMRFKDKLLFTAFPELPLNQAVEVVEKKLLNILGGEVNIDEILKKRFLYLGYGNTEGDRMALRNGALKNQQSLGGKKVFEWLQAFDKAFPPDVTEEVVAGKFFAGYSDVASLSKTEQAILKRLLQAYDEWLRAPLTSIFDTATIYKKLNELERAGVKEINVKTFVQDYFPSSGAPRSSTAPAAEVSTKAFSRGDTISLPLLQALSKYERLGEQLITGGRIRVKSQPEPVRPSLLYWLKYYRDELGIGQHSSVERGDFLFRSENGRKLSASERERVNLILKSVEENFPLSIDTERQEIIFPAFQDVVMSAPKVPPVPKESSPLRTAPVQFQPAPTGLGGQTQFVAPVKRVEFPPAQLAPTLSLPPRPIRANALGTPAFFVPKAEEAELPSTSSFRPSQSGAAHIERGAAFNVLREPAPSSSQAKSVRPNVPGTGEPARNDLQSDSGKVSFSASHFFPAEREITERPMMAPKRDAPAAVRPAVSPAPLSQKAPVAPQPRRVPQPLNMFRIHPVSLGGKQWGGEEGDESSNPETENTEHQA